MVSDGPSRMVKRPIGSGGEPSSPNCGASAGVKARHLFKLTANGVKGLRPWSAKKEFAAIHTQYHPGTRVPTSTGL